VAARKKRLALAEKAQALWEEAQKLQAEVATAEATKPLELRIGLALMAHKGKLQPLVKEWAKGDRIKQVEFRAGVLKKLKLSADAKDVDALFGRCGKVTAGNMDSKVLLKALKGFEAAAREAAAADEQRRATKSVMYRAYLMAESAVLSEAIEVNAVNGDAEKKGARDGEQKQESTGEEESVLAALCKRLEAVREALLHAESSASAATTVDSAGEADAAASQATGPSSDGKEAQAEKQASEVPAVAEPQAVGES